LVFVVAALAIALLAIRPRRVPEWIWPLAGALIVVLLGYESPGGALAAALRQWNVLLFIGGLMGLSAAAEASGAFQWITDVLLERARGSCLRLFVYLFLTGALVTVLLSNDATAIALTPIVYAAVSTRRIDPKPFLFACIFVANTASFGLPFSNPANVLILPQARLLPYVWHLGVPQFAAIAANLIIFLFFFRRQLRGRYAYSRCASPGGRARRALYGMAGVAVAYFIALLQGWPLGPVAATGAAFVILISGTSLRRTVAYVGWSTFALLAGLFVLLDAVTRAGFVTLALAWLDQTLRYGSLAANAIAAGGAALLSNALNNLPVAVASSYVVTHAASEHIAYPLIVGVDLGPNLITTGSLATILWLGILRGYGVRVTLGEYLRLGIVVVPVTLAISVLWLWFAGA